MYDHPQRKYLQHDVPFWVAGGSDHSLFFITVCCSDRCRNQLADLDRWSGLLDSIKYRNQIGIWRCPLFLAMPDHIHAMVRFEGEVRMKAVIRDWKRWTAKSLKINWQRGFFDHRLRNLESAEEKRRYILNNPFRAGLVDADQKWPYCYDERSVGSSRRDDRG